MSLGQRCLFSPSSQEQREFTGILKQDCATPFCSNFVQTITSYILNSDIKCKCGLHLFAMLLIRMIPQASAVFSVTVRPEKF